MARKTKKTEKVKVHDEKKIRDTIPTDEEAQSITPAQYFEYVKSQKHTMTEEMLLAMYSEIEPLAKKFAITNQKKAVEKLQFLEECLKLELPIVRAGYTQYVYEKDLKRYIEQVSDKSIHLISLAEYERDIPDEILEDILAAKVVFSDELYVVFTDYSLKETRKVAKERREKDPILFGAILKEREGNQRPVILDRLYYICDWVDEYCDLTLESLVEEYAKKRLSEDDHILHNIVRSDRPGEVSDAMSTFVPNTDSDGPAYIQTTGTDIVVSNSYTINSLNSVVRVDE